MKPKRPKMKPERPKIEPGRDLDSTGMFPFQLTTDLAARPNYQRQGDHCKHPSDQRALDLKGTLSLLLPEWCCGLFSPAALEERLGPEGNQILKLTESG